MLEMLKGVISKYVTNLLIIITVVGIALFAYSAYRDKQEDRKFNELIGTKEKYEQLTKHTAKLESDYRGQKDLLEKSKREWNEVARAKDERIKLLSDATYLIGRHVEKQDGPDYYFETPKRTKNYVLNELRLAGEDSPPIGYVMIKHDGKTYKRNYEFEILVKNLQTVDEKTGQVKVYSKAFIVMKESGLAGKRKKDLKDWKDVQYPLDIVGGVAYVDPTQPNLVNAMKWWAPHINAVSNFGLDNEGFFFRPGLDLSLSGYGKTKNDLDWKFLHLGLDVDGNLRNPGVHFLPFSYRFFPSLLTNTYIGPGVGYSVDNQMNYFLNLNLSL